MKTRELINRLGRMFPKRLREPWDRGGLMCGKYPDETKKVLVCLDYDAEVLEIAKKERPDLIITHHPFIFGTKAKVLKRDPIKKGVFEETERAGLAVVSYHTNFDRGTNGMNDALAERLGLLNVKPLENDSMARGGLLKEPLAVKEFAKEALKRLNAPYGLLINEGREVVRSVALIGGGGWHGFLNAKEEGYDIYLSGDVPHHGRRAIIDNKYNYLDLPHEIERIFISKMTEILLDINQDLKVVPVDHEREPALVVKD